MVLTTKGCRICRLDGNSSLVDQVRWWKKGVEGLVASSAELSKFVCSEAKLLLALDRTREDRGPLPSAELLLWNYRNRAWMHLKYLTVACNWSKRRQLSNKRRCSMRLMLL